MSPQPFVSLDRRPDGVALVRLDRPKVNALSSEMLDQLASVAEGLVSDPPGAVVVWGGERIFAAGADVSEFLVGGPATGWRTVGADGARRIAGSFRRALDAVASIPRAVIAAINGVALGGGCELALACDLRVAADSARLGQPEIVLGIIPGGGGTQRLARLIGPGRAKEMILAGRPVGAEEAMAVGLVNRVVPAADVLETAVAWASELARGPVGAHDLAKRAVEEGLQRPLPDALDLEEDLFAASFATEDARIGLQAFLEGGTAQFVGR